jgi:TRAP-type C4-dicarboxylate transport system permease small subunit
MQTTEYALLWIVFLGTTWLLREKGHITTDVIYTHLNEKTKRYLDLVMCMVGGLAAAGLLCLVAPWIATFYNQPILTPLMRVLSLTIVINSFGLIQSTILSNKSISRRRRRSASLPVWHQAVLGLLWLSRVLEYGVWRSSKYSVACLGLCCCGFLAAGGPH